MDGLSYVGVDDRIGMRETDHVWRLYREENPFDVDTLILHDGTVSLSEVNRAAKAASKNGSVLVATMPPKGRSWKNLVTLKGGAEQ